MNEKLNKRIAHLVELGKALKSDPELDNVIRKTSSANPWFTEAFCKEAIEAITDRMLQRDQLEKWLSHYDIGDNSSNTKTVGIIMAGNLPLVGFHDFLCAYIAGQGIKIKLSAKDNILFPYVLQKLSAIDPSISQKVMIIDRLEGFDAVIATGSNNSHRYFEYYFRQYPKILRKNRSSVAILTDKETDDDLDKLADDIFMYFGFGCRNVSKLYVPEGYDVTRLFPHFEKYKWMHEHTKYMNNYDYNRTLLLMNQTQHLANEIIMLEENSAISSPAAVVYYERYTPETIKNLINSVKDQIQCIVSNNEISETIQCETVSWGQSQKPELGDYADGIDTMTFLLSL